MPEIVGAEMRFQMIESHGGGPLSTLKTQSTEVGVESGQVVCAVDADGRRHLLIPAAWDEGFQPDRGSAGVHVTQRRLVDSAGRDRAFIDIECRRSSLSRLFSSVVDEVLSALSAAGGETPSGTCQQVLERWRELLGPGRSELLSKERLLGLMAELLLLRRIACRSPAAALNSWRGWESDRFDFETTGLAAEVKASSAREGRSVTIHGVTQLEPPEGATLYLNFVRLEPTQQAGGTSVPDLVRALIQSGVNSAELFRRLGLVGYRASDEEAYRTRFNATECSLFRVDDSFPRIVRSSFVGGRLPERVATVRYRVDLADYPIEPEPALDELVEAMAPR